MKALALLLLIACDKKSEDAPRIEPKPPAVGQGIYGKARVLTGDFMPRPEGTESSGRADAAAGRRVIAFRGTHDVVERIDPKDPTIVGTAVVSAEGAYQIAVPAAGTYTVVLEDPTGGLYACFGPLDETTGQPKTWCWLTVPANTWTEYRIEDNRRATY